MSSGLNSQQLKDLQSELIQLLADPSGKYAPPCPVECINKCTTALNKTAIVDCLIGCGCFPAFGYAELAQSPEASILAHGSANVLGYLLLAVILAAAVVLVGYLVVERDQKGRLRGFVAQEDPEDALYEKLD